MLAATLPVYIFGERWVSVVIKAFSENNKFKDAMKTAYEILKDRSVRGES